jgi:membrane protease YdiL (CAAX protease family)
MDSTDPEIQPPEPQAPLAANVPDAVLTPVAASPTLTEQIFERMSWTFMGSQGLRAGWSVLIFVLLSGFPGYAGLFNYVVGTAFYLLHLVGKGDEFTASTAFFAELSVLLPLLGAAALVALIERRRNLLAFNLTGPQRFPRFLGGLASGFLALSVLVAALTLGGWLHFGPIALSGAEVFKYAVLWGCACLLVGCVEEGTFRCYLQFTLTRGINFWWALGIIGAVCLRLLLHAKGNGVWGVYIIAMLGILPCLWLHLKKTEGAGFWQAAWVTSTLFGFIHTGNNGENPIGIFAAALVGFVFCVSVRVTGSAWWAIGCHASWDWAETYFYGTADSGMVAPGHYLTSSAAGNIFWSGGTDGPEGSILVIGALLLLMAALLLLYGRKNPAHSTLARAIG